MGNGMMKILHLKRINHLLVAVIIFLYGLPVMSGSFSTNFEFSGASGSGSFTLGQESDTVTFSNGEAKSIGNFSLYHSGTRSWMIDSGQVGVIELSNPANSIIFFFRDQNASVSSVLKIFDAADNELNSFNGTTSWTEVNLTNTSVSRITLQNNGGSGYTVIDDFSAETTVANEASPNPAPILEGSVRVRLRPIASGLTAPNWGVAAPGDDTHLYVSDQDGILWRINLISGEKNNFLDLSSRLVSLGISGADSFDERGLLGFAFAPDFQTSGFMYTYTSEPADGSSDFSTIPSGSQADHKSVILELELSRDENVQLPVVPDSPPRSILEIEQPQFNHDGGGLNFGPDGFLYISLGDGGGADDVDGQPAFAGPMIGHGSGNGQDTSNPLGALLRIDPTTRNAANGRYGIPSDNPFVAQNDALDEIFAYGLRNPFRFSFDTADGTLLLADVGQNDIEEVNVIVAGGNYGWNRKEGNFVFDPNGNAAGFIDKTATSPDDTIDPIAEYDHAEGLAIIGGFVYRGKTVESVKGQYVFGDFQDPEATNGRIFYSGDGKIEEFQLTLSDKLNVNVMGFAQDAHGEIYLLGNETGVPFGDTGVVLKIVSNSGFDGSLVKIPVVDVLQSGALVDVFKAELRLVAGSDPALFELMQEVAVLPREYAGDNASFESSTGSLSLPFVDVNDGQGNIATFSAELQKTDTAEGFFFELVEARLIK
jgi:glucose/arabinose dehydrogenase